MRKSLIILACIIIILSGIVPFIDGYLFRKIYLNQFQMYQQLLYQNKNMQLEVVEYHLGWLQSTAKVTITLRDQTHNAINQMPPVVFKIDSIIHHGPIVHDPVQDKYTLSYAEVVSTFTLPDIAKLFIPDNGKGFMQLYSLVPFDGATWYNHYQIPAMSFGGNAKWDGLSGDAVINSIDQIPVKVQGNFTFGSVMLPTNPSMPILPEVSVSPFLYTFEASRNPNGNWNGDSTLKTAGFSAKFQDGRIFNASNWKMDTSYGEKDNFYNFSEEVSLDSLQLPQPFPVETITNIKHQFILGNLSASGVKNYLAFARKIALTTNNPDEAMDALYNILTPSSNLHASFSMNTNLGASMGDLGMSMQSMPTHINDLIANINMVLNARAAKPLVDKVVTYFFANMTPPSSAVSIKQSTSTANVYVDTITDLVKAQKISLNDSLTLVDLQDQKLSPDALDAKLKKMTLDPTVISSLENSYAQTLANKQNAASQPLPQQPVIDPAAQAKAAIDGFIQQGFIISDNNDYVIAFNKKGSVVTLNGKDVSAQFADLVKPMQSGSATSSDASDDANTVVGTIQAIKAAADKLAAASGSYATANLSSQTVTPFVPQGAMTTPWGGTITIGNPTQTTYTITITQVPPATCLAIRAKLDTQLTSNNPPCSMSEPTDLTYTVKAASVSAPAAVTQPAVAAPAASPAGTSLPVAQ